MEREKVRYLGVRPHSGLKDRIRVRFGHERFFWTQERWGVAQQIVEAINSELGEFGCPAYRLRRENVKLVKLEDKISGIHDLYNPRYINLNLSYVERSETAFAYGFIQGVLDQHVCLWGFEEKDKIILRRWGLALMGGKEFIGRELTTAVVQKTAIEVLNKYFPGRFFPYGDPQISREGFIIADLCESISVNNKYPTSKEAFRLFQQAVFGKGDLLPLTRALREVYGPGSLKRLLRGDTAV